MTLHAKCPSCNRSLRIPDNFAGKRVKCPACGKAFQVPDAPVPAAAPPRTQGAPAAARVRRRTRADYQGPAREGGPAPKRSGGETDAQGQGQAPAGQEGSAIVTGWPFSPAGLRSARDHARIARCKSNLRQIGNAIGRYA